MTLTSFALDNFRCFDQRQDVELRPITVLIGKNNAGKSALARWPELASTGFLSSATAPLDLDAAQTDRSRGSFRDLIYGQRPHGSVGFRMRFELAESMWANLRVRIQHLDEYQLQVISHFSLSTSSGIDIDLTWDLNQDDINGTLHYRLANSPQSPPIPIEFFGLLPAYVPPEYSGVSTSVLDDVLSQLRDAFPAVRYVGPFREQPHRHYQLPSGRPTSVGAVGNLAPAILADDALRRKGALAGIVNAYLRDNLPGWTIAVRDQGELYSIVLKNRDDTFEVNLADTGTGVAQVLPMLVQRALDAALPPSRAVLEVVEQPELHLHPQAHASLADVYLGGALASPNCRFIIETHSETFLLRLRRRIAEGVSPNILALYYVVHDGMRGTVRRIHVDSLGKVDYWPRGIFEEDFHETRALVEAQFRAEPGAEVAD